MSRKPAETRLNGPNPEKKCTKCGEFKPLIDFSQDMTGFLGVVSACKECTNNYTRARRAKNLAETGKSEKQDYYANNRENIIQKQREYVLKTRYNLTKEEFDELCKNGCEICYSMERLCADHNHETNEFRGILCQRCNKALGAFEDSSDLLLKAASYLESRKLVNDKR